METSAYALVVLLGVSFVAFLFGHALGEEREASRWRANGDNDPYGRTAYCSRRSFFYVVPEKEYFRLDMLRVMNDEEIAEARKEG